MEEAYIPKGWSDNYDLEYDYAVIKVRPIGDFHVGEVTGTLGLTDQRNLDSETLSIFGYPGDLMSEDNQISQWGMSGSVYNWNQDMVYYKIDTNGGRSGSPMLNNQNETIGVHRGSWLDSETGESIYNGGPKTDDELITFVLTIAP
ncbi:trypsin-like serine peptidase [Virgibacillus salexigens]|uniref:trypsin-like serine peptidase n=1 Tax=Virgibacillus salexigens TaxID=61016 RepID=UPI00190BB772|nr:trypsin-like peptidase domain-containing protein [Virgibacillus salexigens]